MASNTIILCYHRVADGCEDPFLLTATPENFAAHLDVIARHCEPSTLDERDLPSRRPRVVITFDDGYVDNLTHAMPIAREKGVPITVYVASGVLGQKQGFWWDRLGTLLRDRPAGVHEMRFETTDGPVSVVVGADNVRDDLQAVRHHLLPLAVPEIHRVLDGVAADWGTSADPPSDARTMTADELAELARADVVTIGAHTTDHVRLRGLPASEQQDTMASSKDELEQLSGRSISHFAYPYGGPDSFDANSVDAARRIGFDTACTTIPANARSTSDPHQLPRRLVMNWGRLRFRASLERWRLVTRH